MTEQSGKEKLRGSYCRLLGSLFQEDVPTYITLNMVDIYKIHHQMQEDMQQYSCILFGVICNDIWNDGRSCWDRFCSPLFPNVSVVCSSICFKVLTFIGAWCMNFKKVHVHRHHWLLWTFCLYSCPPSSLSAYSWLCRVAVPIALCNVM